MFRFTIRDVLWLTVVVGLAVGWYLEHRDQQAKLEALQQPRMADYDLDGRIDLMISNPVH